MTKQEIVFIWLKWFIVTFILSCILISIIGLFVFGIVCFIAWEIVEIEPVIARSMIASIVIIGLMISVASANRAVRKANILRHIKP